MLGVGVGGCVLFEKCIVNASICLPVVIASLWGGCGWWVVCSAISILVCAIRVLVFGLCMFLHVCFCGVRIRISMVVSLWGCWWGVFVGVVVSVLGRSVDALVPGADEGRGRPR